MDNATLARLTEVLAPIWLRIEAQGDKGLSFWCLGPKERKIAEILIKFKAIRAVKGNGDMRLFIVDKRHN